MSTPMWLDKSTSLSWLRAFEELSECGDDVYAILQEPNYEYRMLYPIRGVRYYFTKSSKILTDKIREMICEVKPEVIMYNFCDYGSLPLLIEKLSVLLPDACHYVRTHHEVRRVLSGALLRSILSKVDMMIVSSDADKSVIEDVNKGVKIYVVPFGVDIKMGEGVSMERVIDFASSCGVNPVKNLDILKCVFKGLELRGYKTMNILGQNKLRYVSLLKSTRVFFTPTSSEASGSRSLLEAIVCGAYPVVSDICESTCEVVERLGGSRVSISRSIDEIVDELEEILCNMGVMRTSEVELYSDKVEIKLLVDVLRGKSE